MAKTSTWKEWLKQLKLGEDVRLNTAQLMAEVRTNRRRRLLVRIKLIQAKNSIESANACEAYEKAADTLLFLLKKPKLARAVYQKAAAIASEPKKFRVMVQEIEARSSSIIPAQAGIHLKQNKKEQPVPTSNNRMGPHLRGENRPRDKGHNNPDISQIDQVMIAMKNLAHRAQKEEDLGLRQQYFDGICELLMAGTPAVDILDRRVAYLNPFLCKSEDLRAEVLALLRARERYSAIATLLQGLIDSKSLTDPRPAYLELGEIFRFGLRDLPNAINCFDAVLAYDTRDRRGWTELLESLDDAGDKKRLAKALETRIGMTQGLEQQMLEKQHKEVLAKIKEINEIMRTSLAANVHRTLTGIHHAADA